MTKAYGAHFFIEVFPAPTTTGAYHISGCCIEDGFYDFNRHPFAADICPKALKIMCDHHGLLPADFIWEEINAHELLLTAENAEK